MIAGLLPMALMSATLGVALAFATPRAALLGVAAFAVVGVAMGFLPVPAGWRDAAITGLWISAVGTSLLVHAPRPLRLGWALGAGANGGLWVGAVAAASGAPRDLAAALPAALLFVPGLWLVARGHGIILKVAASWLLAIAILAGLVSLTPTPGYAPDHMD